MILGYMTDGRYFFYVRQSPDGTLYDGRGNCYSSLEELKQGLYPGWFFLNEEELTRILGEETAQMLFALFAWKGTEC